MKRSVRILSALLAALLLLTCCALAEADVPLDFDISEIPEEAVPETALNGDDALALPEMDLPEITLELDPGADAEEESPAPVRSNASDDFVIDNGVLVEYKGPGGNVTIPNGVTAIGPKAFLECSNLKSVTFPDSVTEISDGYDDDDEDEYVGAFFNCDHLVKVTLNSGLDYIGYNAFYGCDYLPSVTIPASVTGIDEWAFSSCDKLTSVTILAEDIDIHVNAFQGSPAYFQIASDSDAIDWADEEGYPYDIIQNGISEETLRLQSQQTHKLTVSGFKNSEITWSSSNTAVATVNQGKVTAKKTGKCVVSAKIPSGKTYKCTVTVYDPAALSQTSLSLNLGKSQTLKVTGLLNRKVTWVSGNSKIATVKNGKVTAVKLGSCVIGAKLSKGKYLPEKTLKCKVTVVDPAALSDKAVSLRYGESYKLSVSGLAGRKVTWATSNKKVATVDRGKVTAVGAGTCNIAAQVENGAKLKCKVTVTDPVRLSKTALSLTVGQSFTLNISGLEGRQVTWSSSDEKVATVERGRIKAVSAGECSIIAQVGGTRLTCAVTVAKQLIGDIHGILGKNLDAINKRLPDKLRYFDDDAYTNDYFLVETDYDDDIISIALLTDAESNIGKYTLYGLYPGMDYDQACELLASSGWLLDTESYNKSFFYNPNNDDVVFSFTVIDGALDLIVYMYS